MIYDEQGVPHTIGGPGKIESERLAIEYMNEDLRQEGKLYDPKTGKGQEYLWQDDSDKDSVMEGKKGLVRQRRPPGSRRHLRLHQGHLMNGKIVSVDTWDVNENKAALDTKAMDDIEKTVNNKWIPR